MRDRRETLLCANMLDACIAVMKDTRSTERSTALYNYLRYGTLSSVRRVAELPCEHAE